MPLTNEAAEIMVHMSIAREIEQDIRDRFENPPPYRRYVPTEIHGHTAVVDRETGDVHMFCDPGLYTVDIGKREG